MQLSLICMSLQKSLVAGKGQCSFPEASDPYRELNAVITENNFLDVKREAFPTNLKSTVMKAQFLKTLKMEVNDFFQRIFIGVKFHNILNLVLVCKYIRTLAYKQLYNVKKSLLDH